VTDVAGTTRDLIEVPVALDGIAYTFIDTAGLRETPDTVESIGVARARKAAELSDILLWLGDPEERPEHDRTILVHARCDLPSRAAVPAGTIPVSVIRGTGVAEVVGQVHQHARAILPGEGVLALNRRQAQELQPAYEALLRAANSSDPLIVAEELRLARRAFARLSGRADVEALLDELFGRFCLGK
jgi:tRNA modification GTPase